MELQSFHARPMIRGMKHIKSRKQKDKETLTSIFKEMAQPRFAESARKEEEGADHKVTKHTNKQNSEG